MITIFVFFAFTFAAYKVIWISDDSMLIKKIKQNKNNQGKVYQLNYCISS